MVPQLVYSRPPAPYPTFPPIPFHHGQQSGISLHSILNGQQGNMSDSGSRPTTTTTSTKIKIRLLVCFRTVLTMILLTNFRQWPGYDEFSRDINAKEHTRQGDPIPKWKLALCVAQVVHAFYSVSIYPTACACIHLNHRNPSMRYHQVIPRLVPRLGTSTIFLSNVCDS